jgi:hypothetical protein
MALTEQQQKIVSSMTAQNSQVATPKDRVKSIVASTIASSPQAEPETGRGAMGDFATGFTKSIINTGRNILGATQDIGQRVLAGITPGKNLEDIKKETGVPQLSNVTTEGQSVNEFLSPKTGGEQTGAIVSEIAQFLVPSSAIVKGQKAVSGLIQGTGKLAQAGRLATKVGTEGLVGGGTVALQRGDITDDDVKTAAIISSMFPIAGSLIKPFGKGVQKAGEKIQTTVLKPSKVDMENGFKIANVNKYGLGGSLNKTIGTAEATMNRLSQQLSNTLAKSDTKLKVSDLFEDTRKALQTQTLKQFGDNSSLDSALNKLMQELQIVAPDGSISIPSANEIKRAAGKKGSWVFGMTDPDSKASEIVYNTFYNKIKTAIEKAAPEVKGINKQLSEIIPIQNAAIRRLPVEMRNQSIGLLDTIGLVGSVFDPKALGIIGANRLAKSGTFGDILVQAGRKLQNPEESNVLMQRFFGSSN